MKGCFEDNIISFFLFVYTFATIFFSRIDNPYVDYDTVL